MRGYYETEKVVSVGKKTGAATLQNVDRGDRVVCVDATGSLGLLKKKSVYTVKSFGSQPIGAVLCLKEVDHQEWFLSRFAHAPKTPPKKRRK